MPGSGENPAPAEMPSETSSNPERERVRTVNSEYCKQALAKVGNPNVLINLVSRRVRQLNSGGGEGSRPLVTETATQGAADIALREDAARNYRRATRHFPPVAREI